MNRLQKRAKVFPQYSSENHCDILNVCLGLRMENNGSSDPWPESARYCAISFLHKCLETWEEGNPHGKRFDDAVKELILATLEEVKREKKSA